MIVAPQTRLRAGFWSQRGGSVCDVGTQLDADSLAEATGVVGEVTTARGAGS
jgi:hypothetical protein